MDGHGHGDDEVTEQIVRAAETLGFFQAVNHGVPLNLLESFKDIAHKFFSLPAQRKVVYLAPVSPTLLVSTVPATCLRRRKLWDGKIISSCKTPLMTKLFDIGLKRSKTCYSSI
ncbi:hypothetical protein HRI_004526500 [Hibiscus trionum]|uniref:Non-haem dioxygenase N-terminal domain-containing protein n=1 Tax=Hibiscus trionum TaxID=183268 RepID=A0A9W7MKV5_HIBTR|nr:hypothetical protein HRI_004526500 [Hibiscus trionum]